VLTGASAVASATILLAAAFGHLRSPNDLSRSSDHILRLAVIPRGVVIVGVIALELIASLTVLLGVVTHDHLALQFGSWLSLTLSALFFAVVSIRARYSPSSPCGCGFGDSSSDPVLALRPLGLGLLSAGGLQHVGVLSVFDVIGGVAIGLLVALVPSAWAIAFRRTAQLKSEHAIELSVG
jgi:hypothetical protein